MGEHLGETQLSQIMYFKRLHLSNSTGESLRLKTFSASTHYCMHRVVMWLPSYVFQIINQDADNRSLPLGFGVLFCLECFFHLNFDLPP